MQYVDGYLLPIPKENIEAYAAIAQHAGQLWMEHGALAYKECVIDHDNIEGLVPFAKAADVKPGEVPVLAFVIFKSREHRDSVNAKVMADPRLHEMCNPNNMPFDCNRMAYGGFTTLVDL